MKIKNETEIQLMKILFKTSGKKPTKNITSQRAYPHGVEAKYYRQLQSYFKPLTDYVKKYINENMEPLLRGDAANIKLDAIPGESYRNMIYNLENWLSIYMPDISSTPESANNNVIFAGLGKTADEAMEFSEKEFKKIIDKGIHVNVPTSAPWWDDMKASWAEDNYTLIVSNARKYVEQINILTEQAIVNGMSPGKLRDEIFKATQSLSDKHCKLLARDQMGKLNGQITQAQMQEIGLDLYVWSTSYDDRVRDSHALMEGLLCRWDDASVCSYDNGKTWEPRPAGAVNLHPGQDIQCRCVGLAFYPELEAEVEGTTLEEILPTMSPEDTTMYMDLFNPNFVKTGWRVDSAKQIQPSACKDLNELYKMAEEVHPEFSQFTKDIMSEFKNYDLLLLERPSLKGIDRIKEKLRADQLELDKAGITKIKKYNAKTDKYNGRYILDIDGNTIVANNTGEIKSILKRYSDDKATIRIKNNFAKPSPVGYSDINMNIKLSNGVIVETQINTTANIVAKNYGHSLYEVFRSISNLDEYKHLTKIMNNAQKDLYKVSNQLSRNGKFPKVTKDILNYSYDPYEQLLQPYLKKAVPEYIKAKEAGLLNDSTIKHFEELCEKIGVGIL